MPASAAKRTATRIKPALPPDETRRLATLYLLEVLDSAPHEQFDRIARIAQVLFAVPMVTISFVDADRDWCKARIGLDVAELPRDLSFASHAILQHDVLVVEDASMDLRFFSNPLVVGPPGVRFYAGSPIAAWNGENIGALGIMGTKARRLSPDEKSALRELAAAIEHEVGEGALKLVDQPTGLMNHRGLRLIANHIMPRASRNGESMSMLFIDFEDSLPTTSGPDGRRDEWAVIEVAEVLRDALRGADIPARMRGDDFAVLLPDTERSEVDVVIARILRELDSRAARDGQPNRLSLRLMKSTLEPSESEFTLERLIATAEAAN